MILQFDISRQLPMICNLHHKTAVGVNKSTKIYYLLIKILINLLRYIIAMLSITTKTMTT